MDEKIVVKIIEKIRDVPTLSNIVSKIIEIVDDPNSSVSDLTDVISGDQALTAKVLKLVNSAFYVLP